MGFCMTAPWKSELGGCKGGGERFQALGAKFLADVTGVMNGDTPAPAASVEQGMISNLRAVQVGIWLHTYTHKL